LQPFLVLQRFRRPSTYKEPSKADEDPSQKLSQQLYLQYLYYLEFTNERCIAEIKDWGGHVYGIRQALEESHLEPKGVL
jgi:hypothetical protein